MGEAVVWVDPRDISLVCSSRRLLERMSWDFFLQLCSRRPPQLVLDGDWDQAPETVFEESDLYRSLTDHVRRGRRWETTDYYRRHLRHIRDGTARTSHRTQRNVLYRCREFEALLGRISREGYRTQADLKDEASPQGNEVTVAIDRNGRLMFVDGQHRLAVAKFLSLPRIPVQIVIRHSRWVAFKREIIEFCEASPHLKGKVYQKIDHPDLADLPAHHGDERMAILRGAIDPEAWAGKRLLDIGAHWGHMCHAFEALGLRCTAIERDTRNVYFLNRLRLAGNRQFSIWQGSVFDYPRLGEFDLILALNVFHHFLRKKSRYQRFLGLLKRLRGAEMILLETHRPEERQMRQAYRNLDPEAFAGFVAEQARLPRIERLGEAPDGRKLYKLSKAAPLLGGLIGRLRRAASRP